MLKNGKQYGLKIFIIQYTIHIIKGKGRLMTESPCDQSVGADRGRKSIFVL